MNAEIQHVNLISALGAVGFGAIIGWFVYYINRYRKGDVQFSDITTVVGVLGGAAITSLFGGASTLFGAYGIGLFIGFFGYFLVLIIFVRNSNGTFNWTWFLDGRRKRLADDEEIQGATRQTVAPMAIQPTLRERVAVLEQRIGAPPQRSLFQAMGAPETSSFMFETRGLEGVDVEIEKKARKEVNDAIEAAKNAKSNLERRIDAAAAGSEEKKELIRQLYRPLTDKIEVLLGYQRKQIIQSSEVQNALRDLGKQTENLKSTAEDMKTATKIIETAANFIDRIGDWIFIAGKVFV